MMTSSKETLGQNRAQLAAGVQGSQARGHGGLSPGGAAGARACRRSDGTGAASPELAGAAACCELVLCPRRVGPARARLGRAGRPHVRDGRPRGRGARPRVRDGQP